MKAAVYQEFRSPLAVTDVPDSRPSDNGVVLEVMATRVCRSDWHDWLSTGVTVIDRLIDVLRK
jgi:D-arabinose 1-dehydrogenase-like Zn-dependent alcohol dehydrogenase